ncbi:hypothetical protein FGB62_220g03 [Gracilaria domingensis]|nr:hypothetical protein FGB62_220g03 [Gracilaria domingensis]
MVAERWPGLAAEAAVAAARWTVTQTDAGSRRTNAGVSAAQWRCASGRREDAATGSRTCGRDRVGPDFSASMHAAVTGAAPLYNLTTSASVTCAPCHAGGNNTSKWTTWHAVHARTSVSAWPGRVRVDAGTRVPADIAGERWMARCVLKIRICESTSPAWLRFDALEHAVSRRGSAPRAAIALNLGRCPTSTAPPPFTRSSSPSPHV